MGEVDNEFIPAAQGSCFHPLPPPSQPQDWRWPSMGSPDGRQRCVHLLSPPRRIHCGLNNIQCLLSLVFFSM